MADLGEKDYADIIKMAATKLQGGLHLDLFPARKRFVNVVFSEKVVPVLTQCIMEIPNKRPPQFFAKKSCIRLIALELVNYWFKG